jgi:hypothetical protein
MKSVKIVLALVICGGNLVVRGGELSSSSVRHRVLKYCDPVCELQSQDSAFSLLIEVYRQNKAHRIQSQYESRLSTASAMSKENGSLLIQADSEGIRTLRTWVLELAKKERDLSMKELQQDVVNYETAYGCSRRVDEQEIGVTVPKRIDTETAAAELQTYSIVALGSTADQSFHVVRPIPASTVLLDSAPIELTGPQIEQCE